MASWKKIIVSGSSASLAALHIDGLTSGLVTGAAGNLTTTAVNGTGNIVATLGATGLKHTGSFTGSFKGDGSGLTGLTPSAVTSYTNATDNRVITSTGAAGINGESSLTFDGTTLSVTGKVNVSTSITGSKMQLTGAPAVSDDTVIVLGTANQLGTREIDNRVWGSTLVDASGTPVANQIPYWTDANTLAGDTGLTYNPTTDVLTVGTSTYGTDAVIAGNLTVNGTTFNANITNINVEDRFILLNSGSATGDGGIIVQTETNYTGVALGWYDTTARFGLQIGTPLAANATSLVPDAFISSVVTSDLAAYRKNGNIRVEGGEIYIYIE